MLIGLLFFAVGFGRVPLAPCVVERGTNALCGQYEVLENRRAAKGRKIPLRILVLPSTAATPAPDPVFLFAGGPGESIVEAAPRMPVVERLRATRHVVAVDQRGTGGSNPLPCAAKNLDSRQAVVGELFDLDRVRACRAELEKRADLTRYTTTNFADDVDEVRAAMGFAQINLYGGSYGTEAALVYLRRHEDRVRSVVLRAVKPVQQKMPLLLSRTVQASIERVLAGKPQASRDFQTILARLAKAPARFTLDGEAVTLSTGAFLSDLRLLLYYPRHAAELPEMLREAARGNWTPFASAHYSTVRAIEPRIARGLNFSVLCAEDVAATTDAEVARETAGSWLGDYQVRHYREVCKIWPRGEAPGGFFDPVRSSKPVLLIAGENDPATPVESATLAAQTLPNSRVIAIRGGTHLSGSTWLDGIVARFVETARTTGLPPCPDASCVVGSSVF
jgi:pimeloyl-ACP methyl ester carboxylesterase